MWGIGNIPSQSSSENESGAIIDDEGFTIVDLSYIRSHPDWYVAIGSVTINGTRYHSFTYRA